MSKTKREAEDKSIKYWSGHGKDPDNDYEHRLFAMTNALNHSQNALLASRELSDELYRSLSEIMECPQGIDMATVPKAGIEAAPEQVVVEMSVGLVRIRRAMTAIKKAATEGCR